MIIADVGSFLFHRLTKRRRLLWPEQFLAKTGNNLTIELKHDVYGRRQTAKVISYFSFFSCNPYINHAKIKQCFIIPANTNTWILLYRELKTNGKSFIFAVCRLPFAVNIMLNLSYDCVGKKSVTFCKIQLNNWRKQYPRIAWRFRYKGFFSLRLNLLVILHSSQKK